MSGYKNDKLIEKLRLGLCLFHLKCTWSELPYKSQIFVVLWQQVAQGWQ